MYAGGGSDPALRASASADAALVAPTPGLPLTPIRYPIRSKVGTSSRPESVPDSDRRRYRISTSPVQNMAAVRSERNPPMSKFKIEHGASKVKLVLLKTNIEDSISNDIDLMCQWSDNERKYIINELLRFALTQEEDFLKYKSSQSSNSLRSPNQPRTQPARSKLLLSQFADQIPLQPAARPRLRIRGH